MSYILSEIFQGGMSDVGRKMIPRSVAILFIMNNSLCRCKPVTLAWMPPNRPAMLRLTNKLVY